MTTIATITEAKSQFESDLTSGKEVICCVCERRSHVDGRPFDISLARALNFMRQWDDLHPGEFVKMAPELNERSLNPGNVAAMLRHWYLIEAEEPLDRSRKDAHGRYRITSFGRDFLLGTEEIPKMVYTYKGVVYAWSDEYNPFEDGREEHITIQDVKDFDYNELWLR